MWLGFVSHLTSVHVGHLAFGMERCRRLLLEPLEPLRHQLVLLLNALLRRISVLPRPTRAHSSTVRVLIEHERRPRRKEAHHSTRRDMLRPSICGGSRARPLLLLHARHDHFTFPSSPSTSTPPALRRYDSAHMSHTSVHPIPPPGAPVQCLTRAGLQMGPPTPIAPGGRRTYRSRHQSAYRVDSSAPTASQLATTCPAQPQAAVESDTSMRAGAPAGWAHDATHRLGRWVGLLPVVHTPNPRGFERACATARPP